jgi:hypothetical protein
MNFFAMDALRVVLTIKKQMMKNKIQQGWNSSTPCKLWVQWNACIHQV